MNSHESLSIVVPFFNGLEHLRRLEGYYRALSDDLPLIFVDDGSTDGSADWLHGVEINAEIISQSNLGLAAARNTGARNARSKFLLMHDVDDFVEIEALKRWLKHTANTVSDLSVANWRHYSLNESQDINYSHWSQLKPTGDFLRDVVAPDWSLPPHAYLISKELWDSIGGGDQTLVNAQDFDLWARAALEVKNFTYFSEGVANYLRNAGEGRLSNRRKSLYCSDYRMALEKLKSLSLKHGKWTHPVKLSYAKRCARLSDMAAVDAPGLATWFLDQALENAPPTSFENGLGKRLLLRLLGRKSYLSIIRLYRLMGPRS